MQSISLGKIVFSSGTPVNLGTIFSALSLPAEISNGGKVFKIEIAPALANTHPFYVGLSPTSRQGGTMDTTAGTNVLKQVAKPNTSGGSQDKFVVAAHDE